MLLIEKIRIQCMIMFQSIVKLHALESKLNQVVKTFHVLPIKYASIT